MAFKQSVKSKFARNYLSIADYPCNQNGKYIEARFS